MESEGHFLILAPIPYLIRRRCYCRLKILSNWSELALSFPTSLSFLSLSPLLFSFLSLSVPLFSTPEAQSAEPVSPGRRGRSGWSAAQAVARPPGAARRAEQPLPAETALRAYISEASAGALPPALPYALSGSSQARLPPPTGFILGRTRPSAWQITRDARVFPRRRPPRPERSASRDAGVKPAAGAGAGGACRPGASWRALALARRPGTRQRRAGLPGSGRKRPRFLRQV